MESGGSVDPAEVSVGNDTVGGNTRQRLVEGDVI